MNTKTILLVTLYLCFLGAANANQPIQVKDIQLNGDSTPRNFTTVNNKVFFSANDGVHGQELWVTDGSKGNTKMVRDITPGLNSETQTPLDSFPTNFIELDQILYFTANDIRSSGKALWRSDGTENGTILLQDEGGYPSNVQFLTRVGDTIFFSARAREKGVELWKTDGSIAGTVLVKDIFEIGFRSSVPSLIGQIGSELFFTASNGVYGRELWKSDGTEAGTVLIKDMRPGPSSSGIRFGRPSGNVGDTLFFSSNLQDGVGQELWKSDGTEAGTVLVKNINPENGGRSRSSNPDSFFYHEGIVYFAAEDRVHGKELWKSDGTLEGTTLVKDINPEGGNSNIIQFVAFNDRVFFGANDGRGKEQLWITDGTEAGTKIVKNLDVGSAIKGFVAGNNEFYFEFFDTDDVSRLWRSDGTTAGTQQVSTLNIDNSTPFFDAAGDRLFFGADDGVSGLELWKLELGDDFCFPIPSKNSRVAVICL